MVEESVREALEAAGSEASEEQFIKIVAEIDKSMPSVIASITESVATFWRDVAETRGGWGRKYAQGIKSRATGNRGEVYVDEGVKVQVGNKKMSAMVFTKKLEEGVKSWSIKDALMASKKAKIGKDGVKYITVPFPVSTPRKEGQGKMAAQFGGREMTKAMYDIVKNGGKLPGGSKIGDVDVSGLTKVNSQKFHSQYMMFRRVSEKSTGWVYKAIGPDPVLSEVKENVNKQISEVISAFCKAIVEKYNK